MTSTQTRTFYSYLHPEPLTVEDIESMERRADGSVVLVTSSGARRLLGSDWQELPAPDPIPDGTHDTALFDDPAGHPWHQPETAG